VTLDRRFGVQLSRELDTDDRTALDQAGIRLERQTEPDPAERLVVHAADEREARLRIHAALGGHEELHVQPIDG